jgi:electron transport complex protein RnfD
MTSTRLVMSMFPHIRHGRTVRGMIRTTILALAPSALWGVYQFGAPALVLIGMAVVGAVMTEAVTCVIARRPVSVRDLHAVLVGLMLAVMLPAGAPWWLAFVGGVVAILVGKMPFGPLGSAPLSPALVGLLILALSWPNELNRYVHPRHAPAAFHLADAAPAEPPQSAVLIDPSDAAEYDEIELFLGLQAGPVGTISPILLFLGGLTLLFLRVGRWQGPVGFILGVAVAAAVAHASDPGQYPSVGFQLSTGMVMFGAFFLCTEWSSTPVTPRGLFLFGLIAGALAVIFRLSGLPFGRVAFAVLIVSLATPLLDRLAPTPFGKAVRHA